jgi:hypothetical protein
MPEVRHRAPIASHPVIRVVAVQFAAELLVLPSHPALEEQPELGAGLKLLTDRALRSQK